MDDGVDWIGRRRATTEAQLAEKFGSPDDPESWASGDFTEPSDLQRTSLIILQRTWRHLFEARDDMASKVRSVVQEPEVAEVAEELVRSLSATLYDLMFNILYMFDYPEGSSSPNGIGTDEASWQLIEIDASGVPTGGLLNGLHESLIVEFPGGEELGFDDGWF